MARFESPSLQRIELAALEKKITILPRKVALAISDASAIWKNFSQELVLVHENKMPGIRTGHLPLQ
jgi:hypothetical protein